MSPSILDYPTQDGHLVLKTDASDVRIGTILSTLHGSVVEYASRTLSSTESKYTSTERNV